MFFQKLNRLDLNVHPTVNVLPTEPAITTFVSILVLRDRPKLALRMLNVRCTCTELFVHVLMEWPVSDTIIVMKVSIILVKVPYIFIYNFHITF